MTFLIIFLLGISVGSFLNVLIDRLPRDETVFKGRSYCEKCKKTLRWYDLIPLLSFIFLKGKCRYCHTSLSYQYPVVELLTGLMFVFTSFWLETSIMNHVLSIKYYVSLVYYLFLISSVIVIFVTDLKYGIIPDKILFPTILVSGIYLFLNHESLFLNHLLSAVAAFGFLFLIMIGSLLILKKEGMGFGDVKLAFLMGLVLGYPQIIVAMYVAFLTGALISLILIIRRKKRLFGGRIPFGPFLILGTVVGLYYGDILAQNIMIYVLRL